MSHHGREDERGECTVGWHEFNLNRYGRAVELIKAIANGTIEPRRAADAWLEQNGFDCETSRRRQRERRAEQLDQEIAKLQQERAALK